jgi:hypothetical protein
MNEHSYEKDIVFTAASTPMTLEDMESYVEYMDARLARITERLDHVTSHDRLYPTRGCSICANT